MDPGFFEQPILNSPYEYPSRHWELDASGQPTNRILPERRRVAFITPIPKPKKRRAGQREMVFDEAAQALGTEAQQYDLTAFIGGVRRRVDRWRELPDPASWHVTPETARLLRHWRSDRFGDIRPFFCQVEAVETAIWLTEVAPQRGREERQVLEHLDQASREANPDLARLALKLATGAGKTTVMAMIIAWQTVNAVRRPGSRKFTRGFLVVTPGSRSATGCGCSSRTIRTATTRALDFPWDRWTVFLHPAQRQLVEREYGGPARVAGSAGTGKTIVALHRAVHLARAHAESRVLLATFSDALAAALRARLRRLIGNEPKIAERLEVHSMRGIGRRLYAAAMGRLDLAADDDVRELLREAAAVVEGHRFGQHFLWTEWSSVVDAWQLASWEDYRDVQRLGRKTRLTEKQRELLWSIFSRVRSALAEQGKSTEPGMFARLAAQVTEAARPPFDFCVIDEAQDIGVAELRFLAALGGGRPTALFFAGDLGQRIFRTPFSWRALGVDVRGRSHTLRINYRTSHQIRRQADRLLPAELADVDGNAERRGATVSVFNGPAPEVGTFDAPEQETDAIADWLRARQGEGYAPHAIGVFVRSPAQIDRALSAVQAAGLRSVQLDAESGGVSGSVAVGTMHLAKGLEFRAVAVAACDDEVLPLQARLERVGDDADLEEVYGTERHLLYVACTRARDRLLVTGVDPGSEFLDDLREER